MAFCTMMQHTLYKSRIQAWPKTTAKLPSHEPTSKPSQNHITVKLRVRKATVNALSIGLEQKKKGSLYFLGAPYSPETRDTYFIWFPGPLVCYCPYSLCCERCMKQGINNGPVQKSSLSPKLPPPINHLTFFTLLISMALWANLSPVCWKWIKQLDYEITYYDDKNDQKLVLLSQYLVD